MPAAKIPPVLHAALFAKFEEGLRSDEIAAWLWREHHVEVHPSNVRRLLERTATERGTVNKDVIRGAVRKRLLGYIDRIDRIVRRAAAMERDARERAALHRQRGDWQLALAEDALALKAQDRQAKAIERMVHWSGINQPDQGVAVTQPQDARAALLGRLRTLLAAEVRNGAAEDPTLAN